MKMSDKLELSHFWESKLKILILCGGGGELKFHLLKKCNLTIPNTYFLESAMGKWWLVNQLTWNLIVVKKKFVIYVPIPSQFSIFPVHDKLHKINENSYEQKVIPIG